VKEYIFHEGEISGFTESSTSTADCMPCEGLKAYSASSVNSNITLYRQAITSNTQTVFNMTETNIHLTDITMDLASVTMNLTDVTMDLAVATFQVQS